jgi:hypothetical protein
MAKQETIEMNTISIFLPFIPHFGKTLNPGMLTFSACSWIFLWMLPLICIEIDILR